MSDWIDLQLAHSLTPERAPEELWNRIQRASQPRRTRSPIRWAVPAAIAAGVVVVLAQPVRVERFELVSGKSARVESWLAHKPAEPGSGGATVVVPVRSVPSGRSDAGCRHCHTL